MSFNNIDTPIHIRKKLIAGYRKMTPQQKLQRVNELTKAVQQLALARIRKKYGNISEREQQLRLGALWLTKETMMRVFHWDPNLQGF